MAIWTVSRIDEFHAVVYFQAQHQISKLTNLGHRRYPLSWLVLYKRGERVG